MGFEYGVGRRFPLLGNEIEGYLRMDVESVLMARSDNRIRHFPC